MRKKRAGGVVSRSDCREAIDPLCHYLTAGFIFIGNCIEKPDFNSEVI